MEVEKGKGKEKEYENICFAGCGTLGFAYLGVLDRLLEKPHRIRRFCGTSAGALFATALACCDQQNSITGVKISSYLENMLGIDNGQVNHPNWLDSDWFGIYRLFTRCGYYKGEYLLLACQQMLKALTGDSGITFSELFAKTGNVLVLTGTRYGDCIETEYFGTYETPEMPIAIAMRISGGFPCLFPLYDYNNKQYIDGGVLNNFPIDYFDSVENNRELVDYDTGQKFNTLTLGVKVTSVGDDKNSFVNRFTFVRFVVSVLSVIYEKSQFVHAKSVDKDRVIDVLVSGSNMDFDKTYEQIVELRTAGYAAAAKFV